jgi:hypothetical protein
MRIPNTPYLVYVNNIYKKTYLSYKTIARGVVHVLEIAQWKKEKVLQRENINANLKAKQYAINGPANIRDNPSGKIIATLNDLTLVLVLENKGDWYHILYASVDGWTHKDNLILENGK